MNKKPIVSVAGSCGSFENVKNALSQIDLSGIKNKTVLLKPNAGRAAKPEHGYNTHPEAIAACIEAFKEAGALKIAIGESPLVGIDTFEAFKKAGITEVAKRYNVELIDLNAKPPVVKDIPHPRILKTTKICQEVFNFDLLVSVPVAKTHMHTGVTLGIKNLKGCLYRHEKVRYHQLEYIDKVFPEKTLDSAISDLASILIPDLTVIDGYIGMEGLGPSGGDPIKSDFAIASWNPVGADVFGCVLMGIDPNEIPHLQLISKHKKMSLNPDAYQVNPPDYETYIVNYERPPKEISTQFENIVVYDCESCSACLSTLMLFLRRFKDDMEEEHLLDDGKFHIGIGKGIKNAKDGTVLVGNCARKTKCEGIHVKGCPPVPTRIYEAVMGHEPEENEPEVE